MYIQHKAILLGVTALLMCSGAPTVATAADVQIEEITVVGEKRDANLQDVPLAISAITDKALDEQSVFNLSDMTGRIPGLVVNKSEGTDRTVTLRGLGKSGSTQNGTVRTSVAYHEDGIYYRNSLSTNQDLFDVERVEFIRGPTGTVFGQSSIGGVINVITKRPELDKLYGHVDVSAGTEGNTGGRLYFNVPISDTLAVRASYQNRRHDGYSQNVFLGVPLDEENNTSAKLQILWAPTENLDFLLRARSFDMAENNGRAQKSLLDTTPGERYLNQNFPGLFGFQSADYSLEINYSTDWFDVKSITAFQDADAATRTDNDRANLAPDARPGFITDNRILNFQQDREQLSQEITISSNNSDSRFTWLVGAYYADMEGEIEFIEGLDNDSDGFIPDWDIIKNVDETLLFPDAGFIFRGIEDLSTEAFYANATFNVTDKLQLIGGIRTSDDESNPINSFFFGPFAPGNATKQDSDDFKIGLNYSLTDDILAYVNFATGSKPNGGSLLSAGSSGGQVTLENFSVPPFFLEEENDAIEVGIKFLGMNDRLQINSALFVYDLSNYQFLSDSPTPFGGGAVNASAVDVWGFETEITALLSDKLRIDLSASYLDTEVKGFTPALDTINANEATAASAIAGFGLFSPENIAARQAMVEDLDGNELPAAPEMTVSISATYTAEMANNAELEFNINYAYHDGFFARIYNDPVADVVPSSGLLAATVRYVPDARWSLELIGSNLTDDEAVNNTFTDIFGVGATGQEFNPPRVVMLRLNVDF